MGLNGKKGRKRGGIELKEKEREESGIRWEGIGKGKEEKRGEKEI